MLGCQLCNLWKRSAVETPPALHPHATCLCLFLSREKCHSLEHKQVCKCFYPAPYKLKVITWGLWAHYTYRHTYSYPRHTCRFNKTAPILMASLTSRLYISCGKRGGLWLLGGSTSMYTVQMECLRERREHGI